MERLFRRIVKPKTLSYPYRESDYKLPRSSISCSSFNPRGDRSFIHAILSFVAFPLLPGMEGGIFLARNWRGSVPSRGTTKRRENRGEAIYIFPWMARTRARVSTRASSMPRREETAGVGPYTHKRRNAILIIGSDYLRPTRLAHRLRVSFNFSHFDRANILASVFLFSSGVHVNFRGITRTITFARSFSKEEVRGSRQLIPRIWYRVEGRSPKTGDRKEASCQDWKRGPAGIDGHHL